jgi:hypothetical protein
MTTVLLVPTADCGRMRGAAIAAPVKLNVMSAIPRIDLFMHFSVSCAPSSFPSGGRDMINLGVDSDWPNRPKYWDFRQAAALGGLKAGALGLV